MIDDAKKALKQMHQLGFLHRDIKGDNMVVVYFFYFFLFFISR